MSNVKHTEKKDDRTRTMIFMTMLIGGILALAASLVLSLEKIHLLQQPDAILSCTFNLILNCSTVMQTWQASVFFGIPNMYFGLMAFAVIITVAVAGLSGVKFPRPFMVAAFIGYLLGTVFAYWLFLSSVYVIEVLCPWCLVVTFSCTLILSSMTKYAIYHNIFQLRPEATRRLKKFIDKGFYTAVVIGWLLLMVALVFAKFGTDLFA